MLSVGRDGSGAGAVDVDDFIQSFEDVPTVQVCFVYSRFFIYFFYSDGPGVPLTTNHLFGNHSLNASLMICFLSCILALLLHSCPALHQIYSNREVEEAMTKIRDVLSDDKKDWELRVAAVRRPDLSLILV